MTLAELEQVPLGLPDGLELEWLGVAGYRITYEGVSLLVDPYVSRVPLRALLLRRATLPDDAALARYVRPPGAVAGILIGHTHWDHAVDAPALARRHRATTYGSDSLARLMALHGQASVVVEPRRRYELGPFVVSFTPSRHSKLPPDSLELYVNATSWRLVVAGGPEVTVIVGSMRSTTNVYVA